MPRRTYDLRKGRRRPTQGSGSSWITAIRALLERDQYNRPHHARTHR